MSDADELIAALQPVVEVLCSLGIRHYVGGSVASSFHGAIRSTMDVDLVCELRESQVPSFVASFSDDFYVSPSAVEDAVRRKSCFNLIHLPTAYKVDVFVSRGRPFDEEAMHRATVETLGDGGRVAVPIATAEDSIVSKLEWFRLTNETSERQWHDVTKIVAVLGDSLDTEHMRRMAASIGVDDLLDKLLAGR